MNDLLSVEELAKMQPTFGPTGQVVYESRYSREKQDGIKETFLETIIRTVDGNLALVNPRHNEPAERLKLINLFFFGKALPAGRHLWMSGIPGRQFLFNCHVSHWDADDITAHYTFTFDQLMQGGGVGSNYSNRFVSWFPRITSPVELHIVCDKHHDDYDVIKPYLSQDYAYGWPGNFQVEDSREGWCAAQRELLHAAFSPRAESLIVDVSRVREAGALIRTFGGLSAGPEPLVRMLTKYAEVLNDRVGGRLTSVDHMLLDHFTGEAVISGNVRRSARMSIKYWQDHDIWEFIKCKEDPEQHWSTNISVEIDDSFFRAYKRGNDKAVRVYNEVTKGMLLNGEPGFWNSSLSNVGETGQIVCTNPCGEIALEPWENCNLGHVNLSTFADDIHGAYEAHRLMTRFLLRATFGDVPNDRQREVLHRNRRIGVGHFGFQGWLNKMGIRYSESHTDTFVRTQLKEFKKTVRDAAREYAFELRIPEPVKVTTEAPTGTIAKLFGTTEGIHPNLYVHFERRVRFATNDVNVVIEGNKGFKIETALHEPNTSIVVYPTRDILIDEVADVLGDTDRALELVESAYDIPLEDMLAVQEMVQTLYADNAVSFTINVPTDKVTLEQLRGSLIHYLPRLKGTTIFPEISRPQAPYTPITKEEWEAATAIEFSDGIDENCSNGSCPIGNEAVR